MKEERLARWLRPGDLVVVIGDDLEDDTLRVVSTEHVPRSQRWRIQWEDGSSTVALGSKRYEVVAYPFESNAEALAREINKIVEDGDTISIELAAKAAETLLEAVFRLRKIGKFLPPHLASRSVE